MRNTTLESPQNHETTMANAATLRQVATANVMPNIIVHIVGSDACRRERYWSLCHRCL